ncbi:transketolase C-terminal domain-containing protein [Polymorphospora sp. NPDC050346]|uniref:alpha-ketoacid dehydrogenase subunit beta n=1 Tax=Polymorphospora sp. NPDC050346 TaxID=3155780 RepID=UPI003410F220
MTAHQTPAPRVAEDLNRALHEAMSRDERVVLLGQDILDPYGGAFKITKGLSSRFPDRVIGMPISEQATVGIAGGLALCGNRPIIEIMFADFVTLAYDQILNFLTKSVSMYGRRVPMPVLIRCPVGGDRGYGPTHSQYLHKQLLGIPHLTLFELSPFHPCGPLLEEILSGDEPAMLFENKLLYGRRVHTDGIVDDLFQYDYLDPRGRVARISIGAPADGDVVVIAPGGLCERVLSAARRLFLTREIRCQILVPVQLYPLDLTALLPTLAGAARVCVVEEDVAGATWGADVARAVYERLWRTLRHPVTVVSSRHGVIPAARVLEKQVVVQADDVYRAIAEDIHA